MKPETVSMICLFHSIYDLDDLKINSSFEKAEITFSIKAFWSYPFRFDLEQTFRALTEMDFDLVDKFNKFCYMVLRSRGVSTLSISLKIKK